MGSHVNTDSPLIRAVPGDGHREEMLCPNCETWQDVLAYKNLQMRAKYANALNVNVKCTLCKHVFSPRWANQD